MLRLLLFIIMLVSSTIISAQEIITATLARTLSEDDINGLLGTFTSDITAESGVDIYSVTYSTTGSDSRPDTASGLIVLPQVTDTKLPILAYHHGTISGRSAAPSFLAGQEYLFSALFASQRMAVTMPDYLGLGQSRGMHPYVHADTEGSASTDLIIALMDYMDEQKIERNDQVFLTGYSQGGHATMATHRYLQQNHPEIKVTASAPMSGPYFISGVMRGLLDVEENYFYPAYLVYSFLALDQIDPTIYDDLSEVFKEPYIPAIEDFIVSQDGLFDLNRDILQIMVDTFGNPYPKFLFQEDFAKEVMENDDHPVNALLRTSDLHNWIPEAPVLMIYCSGDDQVPGRNSIVADSTMNALGAADVSSVNVETGTPLSHGQCILPALLTATPWILEQIERTTPTDDVYVTDDIKIGPVPVNNQLSIQHHGNTRLEEITLYDLRGTRLIYQRPQSTSLQLDMSDLRQGMYILSLTTDQGIMQRQIIKM